MLSKETREKTPLKPHHSPRLSDKAIWTVSILAVRLYWSVLWDASLAFAFLVLWFVGSVHFLMVLTILLLLLPLLLLCYPFLRELPQFNINSWVIYNLMIKTRLRLKLLLLLQLSYPSCGTLSCNPTNLMSISLATDPLTFAFVASFFFWFGIISFRASFLLIDTYKYCV